MAPRAGRQSSPASESPAAPTKSLALIGFMGSGKSVVGALVAYRAGAAFFDLDSMVEAEAGSTIADIFATRGESAFRALESRLLPSALQTGAVAALGGGSVIDDTNWQIVRERAETVYLELPFQSIWDRVGHSHNRPLLAGRLRKEVELLFESRRARYEQADHRVAADRSPDEVAGDVLALWSD